jgi:hypothetical protein
MLSCFPFVFKATNSISRSRNAKSVETHIDERYDFDLRKENDGEEMMLSLYLFAVAHNLLYKSISINRKKSRSQKNI